MVRVADAFDVGAMPARSPFCTGRVCPAQGDTRALRGPNRARVKSTGFPGLPRTTSTACVRFHPTFQDCDVSPSTEPDSLEPRSADPPARAPNERLQRAREELLTVLIPPLVHRLNNSLGVMVGVQETAGVHGVQLALEECDRASSLLTDLSNFSRTHKEKKEHGDAVAILRSAGSLVRPLANVEQVELEVVEPGRVVPLHASMRELSQLVTVLMAAEVEFRGRREGPRAHIRLELRVLGDGVALLLTAPRQPESERLRLLWEAALEWAALQGLRAERHALGDRRVFELVLAERSLVSETSSRLEPSASRARVLLLDDEPEDAELTRSVLEDAGHTVLDRQRVGADCGRWRSERVDLVVVSSSFAEGEPELFRALAEHPDFDGRRLLLGPISGERRRFAMLDRNVRPDAFLEAVEALFERARELPRIGEIEEM